MINIFLKSDDLVFTKANKGETIVILHVENYTEKPNKASNDKNYCLIRNNYYCVTIIIIA